MLEKLIDVKSIVMLVLTCVFSYLAIAGKIETQQVMIIYTTIISFFFGTQKQEVIIYSVLTGVLTALISGLCVAIPSVYASSKNSKAQAELTAYRLNELKTD